MCERFPCPCQIPHNENHCPYQCPQCTVTCTCIVMYMYRNVHVSPRSFLGTARLFVKLRRWAGKVACLVHVHVTWTVYTLYHSILSILHYTHKKWVWLAMKLLCIYVQDTWDMQWNYTVYIQFTEGRALGIPLNYQHFLFCFALRLYSE